MTVIPFPGTIPAIINRSGAHAAAPGILAEQARFQPPVTDLDVARLLYALESGTPVVQGGDGWTVPAHSPLRKREISRIAREAIRTGLARPLSEPAGADIVRVRLLPSPTHLRSLLEPLVPLCGFRALRYRLIYRADFQRDHALVDCDDCLRAY